MQVIASTDNKYTGKEVPSGLQPGDTIQLGDFDFEITFVRKLENGNIAVGNTNYQLECKE